MVEKLYPIKLYLRHLPHAVMIGAALVTNLAIWIDLLQIQAQTDSIFLHYNILFGVDYIGEWWKIFYLPIGGLCIIILNTIIGWILWQRDKFAGYVLGAISIFCQIFLLIAAFLLVFLNV